MEYNQGIDFVGADFHVHTPASSCWKSERTDEKYIAILKMYHDAGIKIIAITDHNTLSGYKKLISIKAKLKGKIDTLSEFIDKHPELQAEINEINNVLKLFSELLILPGVEYEAKPGVHILLIFDQNADLDIIERFLIDTGYDLESQCQESPLALSTLDVIDLLSEAKKIGALTIAAHADSDKGIYNVLTGKHRALTMGSSNLNAISYNNVKTKDIISSLFANKEYTRKEPIAFIQASDYHGEHDKLGKNISYIKVDKLNFQGVTEAFTNPSQCISPTERPEIVNIINQVVSDPNSICIENISNPAYLMQAVCASLNNGFGSIVIGVEPKFKNVIGIDPEYASSFDLITEMAKSVMPPYPSFEIEVNHYNYGKNIVVVCKLASKACDLFYLADDDRVYRFEDGIISVANPSQIYQQVEQRFFDKLQIYEKKTEERIDSMMNDLKFMINRHDSFRIMMDIEKQSVKIKDIISYKVIPTTRCEGSEHLGNGNAIGNVVFIPHVKSRLSDAYLRVTAPVTNKITVEHDSPTFTKPALVLAPGGGVFYADSIEEWQVISLSGKSPIVFNQTLELPNGDKFLLAWLKSSLFLWHCYNLFGDFDIYPKMYFDNIGIPLFTLARSNEVIDLVDQIIALEKSFLKDFPNLSERTERLDAIDKHNRSTDVLFYKIDEAIYHLFNLSASQVASIEEQLICKSMYIPKINTAGSTP